jgi:hypothetical protein
LRQRWGSGAGPLMGREKKACARLPGTIRQDAAGPGRLESARDGVLLWEQLLCLRSRESASMLAF